MKAGNAIKCAFHCTLILLLGALVTLALGCQAYNTATQDPNRFQGETKFDFAKQVFATRCTGCHDYGSIDEAEFITRGLVVAAHPEQSKIVLRMKGGGYDGAEDMPPNGGAVPSVDVQKVIRWIEAL